MKNIERVADLWQQMGFQPIKDTQALIVPCPEEIVQSWLTSEAAKSSQNPKREEIFESFKGKAPIGRETQYQEFITLVKNLNDGKIGVNDPHALTTEANKKVEEARLSVLRRDHLKPPPAQQPAKPPVNPLVARAFEKADKVNR